MMRTLLDCLSGSESPSTRKMTIRTRLGCISNCGPDSQEIVHRCWTCDVSAVQHESTWPYLNGVSLKD